MCVQKYTKSKVLSIEATNENLYTMNDKQEITIKKLKHKILTLERDKKRLTHKLNRIKKIMR